MPCVLPDSTRISITFFIIAFVVFPGQYFFLPEHTQLLRIHEMVSLKLTLLGCMSSAASK